MFKNANVRRKYSFKAATGFGAVIEGTVEGTDSESVSRELLRQGLIPTNIRGIEVASRSFLGRVVTNLRGTGRTGKQSAGTAGS